MIFEFFEIWPPDPPPGPTSTRPPLTHWSPGVGGVGGSRVKISKEFFFVRWGRGPPNCGPFCVFWPLMSCKKFRSTGLCRRTTAKMAPRDAPRNPLLGARFGDFPKFHCPEASQGPSGGGLGVVFSGSFFFAKSYFEHLFFALVAKKRCFCISLGVPDPKG